MSHHRDVAAHLDCRGDCAVASWPKPAMHHHDRDIPDSTTVVFRRPQQRTTHRTTRRWAPLAASGLVVAVAAGGFFPSSALGQQTTITVASSATHQPVSTNASTSTARDDSIGTDGTVLFHGLTWQVPTEWVHSSYDEPCSEPITDCVIVATYAKGPSKGCLSVTSEPISGILIASQDIAGTWGVATARATKQIHVNGLLVFTGSDPRGDTVVVIPDYKTAFRIQGTDEVVRQVVDSVHRNL